MPLPKLDDEAWQAISDMTNQAAELAEDEEEERESMERRKLKRILSCKTNEDIGYQIDSLAMNTRRTVSSHVAQAVEEYLSKQPKGDLKRKKGK